MQNCGWHLSLSIQTSVHKGIRLDSKRRIRIDLRVSGKEPGPCKKLYEENYGSMYAICIRYTSSKEEAVIFFNDAFLKIFNKIENLWERYDVWAWMKSELQSTPVSSFSGKESKRYITRIWTAPMDCEWWLRPLFRKWIWMRSDSNNPFDSLQNGLQQHISSMDTLWRKISIFFI